MNMINFSASPMVFHSFNPFFNRGGATVVAFPVDADTIRETRKAYVAVAQCSEKDSFTKKEGMRVAVERAEDSGGFFIRFPRKATFAEKRRILHNLASVFNPNNN